MKLNIRRSCLSFLVLSALIKTIQSNENETGKNETRRGRVNGRIVKLYSGYKPDPIMCHNEGFQADPMDCSVFYRCVQSSRGKFNVFRFQCGPGTVYDPETEICNHASNTKRSECGGAIALNNHEINGNGIDTQELPLPITTSPLNIKVNVSVTPISISEKDLNTLKSTTPSLTPTAAVNQQFSKAIDISGMYPWDNKNSGFTPNPLFSTKPAPIDKNDPCTFDGFVGDSYDCKKFYRCVNNFRGGFTRYEFVCGDSTIWDDDKQSCNYAWAVRSRRCGRDATSNNVLNDITTHHENENSIVEKEPNENRFGEKIQNSYNSYDSPTSIHQNKDHTRVTSSSFSMVTIPYDNENIATDKNDVPSHFNDKQNNSYLSGTTHSRDREIKKQLTTSSYISLSTEHTLLSNSKKDSRKSLNNICSQSGFMGDPNDCKKFYRCVDNGQGSYTKYEFSCSQGTLWDSEIEACNHAWAVKSCGNTAFTQGLTTESSVSNGVNTEINSLPEEMNNIDDNFGYPNLVDQDHMKTTTSKIETTFSLPATNEEANIFEKSCSTSGYFVNLLDCSKFYRCVENGKGSFTRFDYNCGEGTVWDESIEACNHAWAVKSCRSNSENLVDTEQMTTITLVQTTTQKNKDNNDYESIYGSQQSTIGSNIVTEISTTTLKQTLPSQNECNTNGFMGDSSDCKKFYRCVENADGGYTKYEFSCGDETVWDPIIEACNHNSGDKDCTRSSSNNNNNTVEPTNSNEDLGEYNGTSSSQDPDNKVQIQSTTSVVPSNNNLCETAGFMGDSNDCEKFYRCVENGKGGYNRIEFNCAEGTVWDSSIEACNHRWAVEKCGKDSSNEFIETTIDSMSTVTDKTPISTKPPEYSETSAQYTSTERTNISEDSCSSEGFFGSSHGECNKFYRCVDNGKGGYDKYEFTCGEGTVWDENIKACNHDTYNKTCRISDNKPQTDTTISTEGAESTTHAVITNVQEPSKPDDKECKSEGFIANPIDCHKFFRCVDNGEGGYSKFEFSCGEGTVWVQEIQACDHDTGENSCNQQNVITTNSSPQVETTTSSVVTESSLSTQSTVEDNSNHKKDNEECTNQGFHPNKNDCQRFYRCVENDRGGFTKYEFTCAQGTAWDTLIQSCNYIEQVSSCKNVNISETEMKPDSIVDTVSETQENTTSTTLHPTTSSTNRPDETLCMEEGFFGDNEDCKKFYRCVSNENEGFVKYDFTCSDGTIWDQDILACNHAEDVSNPSCKLNETSSTISSTIRTTTASSNTEVSSVPPTTSQPSVSSSTPMDSATTIKDSNSNCSQSNSDHENNKNYTCTKAGFYADPNDCKKFYRCVDWESNGEKFSIYHFECGDGTIWDPALETCNHEDSVYPPRNCNGKEQPNQTSGVSPSTAEVSTTTSSETEASGIVTETETTSTTTSPTTVQSSTTTFSTEESTFTTTQMTTTQPSTTPSKQTTTQTSTTETSTVTMSTSTESSTKPSSTTIASTTTESSTQKTSTTNSEEPTTDSSSQTTTDMTEVTTSVSSTTIVDESTTTSTQSSSTIAQASTTETTTTTEDISSSTTENQSTGMESTTATNGEVNSTESNTSANKDCPDTEKDQSLYVCPTSFKRHPKYCNLFYQCTEDNDNHEVKIAIFNCPNNTIYDENKVQCVEEKQATKKCNGQISQRNRIKRLGAYFNEPVIVSENSLRCSEAGHFPFQKREQCSSAFLKCEYATSGQLRGYVYKCPEGFVYWSISRRCEAMRKVRDCKLSSYNWNNRYDIPVEQSNIAY